MRRSLNSSNRVKGPVRNDRVSINAINAIYRNVDLTTASEDDRYVLLSTVSHFIGAMSYNEGHAEVIRTWRKFVNDLFPNDGHQKYRWIDEGILKQKNK